MKHFAMLAGTTSALFIAAHLSAGENAEKKDPLKGIKCPVSGKAVVKESFVDYKEAKLYFCCDNCPTAFKKTPRKFAAKANHQLVATGQAKEVHCPFTGRPLNPDATVDIAGVKVAFCCGNCKGKAAKFEGDAQVKLVFNDKAFAKGFEVKKPAEEDKK